MEFIEINGARVQVPVEVETDSREAVQHWYEEQITIPASRTSPAASPAARASAPTPAPAPAAVRADEE
jgi:hypothetical protein